MKPVLLEMGPITVYSYGAMLALAFFIATSLAMRRAKSENIPSGKILDLSLFILITGIIGSRALHVILHWPDFSYAPLRIFLLNEGGLAIYGGFALAVPLSMWFAKKTNLPPWKTADMLSPYAVLAQAIGRIGCFLNGCCYGKTTDSFFGVYFPGHITKTHPTQIYSFLALILIFIALRYSYRRRRFDGEIFLNYLLLYSLFRFFIEILRGDNPIFAFGFTLPQCASLLLCAISAIFYIGRKRQCRTTLSQ